MQPEKVMEGASHKRIISAEMGAYLGMTSGGIEAGIAKDRGWCLKGKKLSSKRNGRYYKRTNIIAGLVA